MVKYMFDEWWIVKCPHLCLNVFISEADALKQKQDCCSIHRLVSYELFMEAQEEIVRLRKLIPIATNSVSGSEDTGPVVER